jgi:small GTP-binding protein
MKQKKVCMVGSFAVGKTSLVSRIVKGVFSEKYLTTVGVKIDRLTLESEGENIQLMLWDIEGEDQFAPLQINFLRGAHGLVFVVDHTRRATLAAVKSQILRIGGNIADLPHILFVNKCDLEQTDFTSSDHTAIRGMGVPVLNTSAKTALNVPEGFAELTRMMRKTECLRLEPQNHE